MYVWMYAYIYVCMYIYTIFHSRLKILMAYMRGREYERGNEREYIHTYIHAGIENVNKSIDKGNILELVHQTALNGKKSSSPPLPVSSNEGRYLLYIL